MAINFNDPLYAYNTAGFTNQNDGVVGSLAANVEGAVGTVAAGLLGNNQYIGEPEALSGYVARSMDPAVNSAQNSTKATFTNQVLYLTALEVLDPAQTSKFVVSVGTVGGTSTTLFGLYNSVGAQVAASASVSNIAASTISRNWTASAVLYPGTYWFGWLNTAAASGAVPFATAQTSEQTLLSGTTFPGTTFRWISTGSSVAALPTSLTTGFTGAGTVASFTTSWFAGIG